MIAVLILIFMVTYFVVLYISVLTVKNEFHLLLYLVLFIISMQASTLYLGYRIWKNTNKEDK